MPRINAREARGAVARRENFRTHGALSGQHWDTGITLGLLPDEHRQAFMAAERAAKTGANLYVVMSYSTPIAWDLDGEVTVPDVRYSVTTSRHQGIARSLTH